MLDCLHGCVCATATKRLLAISYLYGMLQDKHAIYIKVTFFHGTRRRRTHLLRFESIRRIYTYLLTRSCLSLAKLAHPRPSDTNAGYPRSNGPHPFASFLAAFHADSLLDSSCATPCRPQRRTHSWLFGLECTSSCLVGPYRTPPTSCFLPESLRAPPGSFKSTALYLLAFDPVQRTLSVASTVEGYGPHQYLATNAARDRLYATTWASPPILSSWAVELDRSPSSSDPAYLKQAPQLTHLNNVDICRWTSHSHASSSDTRP